MAIWSDLPSEIIEEILKSLDDADLVNNVSRVNRKLNSLVWREYLRRRDIAEFKSIVVGDMDIRLTLRALRTADWIKNVSTLTIHLSLTHSVFRQIHNLARFVRGLDSLHTLNFSITDLGNCRWEGSDLASSHSFELNGKRILKDLWWGCFRALLNAAFSKGLEGLHIYEPTPRSLCKYIDMHRVSVVRSTSFLRHEIAELWFKLLSYVRPAGWYSKRSSEYPTRSNCLCLFCNRKACRKAGIKDIRLSPMLLSPLFLDDTFGLLNAHASTIHTIHLDETKSYHYDDGWLGLFSRFNFPLLEQFTFTGPPPDHFTTERTDINTLLVFLNHHPTIVHLELANTQMRYRPEEMFTQEAPSLPNLRTLIARNDVAAHILQRPGNCGHLELLHLWSEPATPWGVIFSPGPGRALAAIASNVSHTIKIELRLEAAADCLRWMKEDADIPRQLTQVHDIRILLEENMLQDKSLLFDILPRWLGSFPALEQLRVDVDSRYGTALCTAVLRRCLHLRSLMINNVVVFHSKIK